jgi:hypothetical protein
MRPAPSETPYAAAEHIIKTQGLAFALASLVGKQEELAAARNMLKEAIADAINAALAEKEPWK